MARLPNAKLSDFGKLVQFLKKSLPPTTWLNVSSGDRRSNPYGPLRGSSRIEALGILRQFKYFFLANFSRPASDRCLYRAIRRHGVANIVEIGMGSGRRARRMIQLASCGNSIVRYTAIDPFESRDAESAPGLSIKEAYQHLRPTGAAIQLVPGDPLSALTRVANSLTGTDLLVVTLDADWESLRHAWRYVPRMLHRRSLVYVEEPGGNGEGSRFVRLALGEVNRLAESQPRLHRKAA